MLSIPEVRALLTKRVEKKKTELVFAAALDRPFERISINLKPDKSMAASDIRAFDQWTFDWKNLVSSFSSSDLCLEEKSVRWSSVGGLREVISHVHFDSLDGILGFLDDEQQRQRFQRAIQRLNALRNTKTESFLFRLAKETVLIEASDSTELNQVITLTDYLTTHQANCFIRELPVQGVDTKFLEKHKRLVCALLSIQTNQEIKSSDLFEKWSIKVPPFFVRVRHAQVFFPGIPSELPVALPLASLKKKPRALVILENIQTGLSVKRAPSDVPIVMGLGFQVCRLSELEWVRSVPIYYFGDLDMHGLIILSNLRAVAPQTQSFLMNKSTLENYGHFAVEDPNPPEAQTAPAGLTQEEADLFEEIIEKRTRLEQERIPLLAVEAAIEKFFLKGTKF